MLSALRERLLSRILSRRWNNAVGMIAFALLVIGTFIGFMALDLARMRADAIRTSQRNTAGFALTLAENLGQTVATVDHILTAFVPKLDGRADRSFPTMDKVRNELMAMTLAVPEVQVFAAFDANGERFLNLTGWPYARSSDGASKDYFIAHRENPNLGLSVSKVFQSASGYRIISLSRRLANEDGSFAGTLAISMAPKYLQRVYDQAGFNRNGSISLYRMDGTLLIRHPEAGSQINRSFEMSRLFFAIKQAPSGTLDIVSPVDNIRRITSYRTVAGAPLVIAVSESYDEVLAGWREMMHRYIALGLLIGVAVSGLAYALHRQMANRMAADARFRAAMDSASNAFVLLSPQIGPNGTLDFIIRDANVAAGMLLGRNRDALSGISLAAVVPKVHDADIAAICAKTFQSRDRGAATVTYLQTESTKRWFRVRTSSYADGVVLSMRDATDEQESREALEVAKNAAETANRAKSDFLANMSHELRTPLNAVIGFADIIAQQLFGPVGSDRYREYATLIRMSGAHLLEIISDILDLAKVEANRVVLDEREVDIPGLLPICATLVAGRAEQAGVRVSVDLATDLPSVFADELRLKQIVLNLLSNAVKFSPAGSEVRLGAGINEAGEVAIVVSDRGCGMTEAEIDLALQPFGQVTSLVAKGKEGTGLGLPLARRMAEIHGGRLDIVSVSGEGTVVTLILPAFRVIAPRLAQAV